MNKVIMQIKNNLTQKLSETITNQYVDPAEATYSFFENCGKMLSDGMIKVFAERDEDGYIEEHYTNGRMTIELILLLDN